MHMLYDACYMMHATCYLPQAPVRDLPATLVLCGHAAALTLHCTMCTSSVARGRRRISSNSNLTCNPYPPTLRLTMADGMSTLSEFGRPDTAPGRLPKVPPKSPGMDSPAAPPRT